MQHSFVFTTHFCRDATFHNLFHSDNFLITAAVVFANNLKYLERSNQIITRVVI